ncbi:hypothetical protein JCM8547_002398 [Rhodosporidiobolus lusitaniae]
MASAFSSPSIPLSGGILPSPAALSSTRPSSSSSSHLNQAHQPPPLGERSRGAASAWGSMGDAQQNEREPRALQGVRDRSRSRLSGSRSREASRLGSQSNYLHTPSDSPNPSVLPSATQYHPSFAPPPTSHHRPSSAESTSSSNNPHTLSSPRSQQYSFPSSSLSSTVAADAAFDYDDLLGPRPPKSGSTASISPPSSNEDDKLRSVGSRLQGLGFTSTALGSSKEEIGSSRSGMQEWYEPGKEEGEAVEEAEDHWLHLRSAAIALPTPPTSSPPSQHGSVPSGNSRQSSNTTSASGGGGGGGGIGSPLSPLVAPFSPSTTGSVGRAAGGSPWAASTGGFGARERESSWNAPITAFSPHAGFSSPTSVRTHSREPTFPSQHGSTPSLSGRLPGDILSPSAYQSAHSFPSAAPSADQTDSSSSPYPPTGLFAPPTSQPMSQASSRDALFRTKLELEREIPVDRGGYARPGTSTGSAALAVTSSSSALSVGGGGGSVSGDSLPTAEEISTLFVVGFPDDMHEREFHNMFAFAEGFEAATLKVPAATAALREWEREVGVVGVASVVGGGGSSTGGSEFGNGGGSGSGGEEGEHYASALPPHLVASTPSALAGAILRSSDPYAAAREAAGSPLGFGGASSSGNGSANGTGTGNGSSTPAQRKQIIGFARFKTRQQALDARDVLTGKKVDPDKGNVLKAEMAKKNLHARKNVGLLVSGPGVDSTAPSTPAVLGAASFGHSSSSAFEQTASSTPATTVASTLPPGTGPSIPLSVFGRSELDKIAQIGNLNPAVLAEIARQSAAQAAANRAAQAPPPTQGDGYGGEVDDYGYAQQQYLSGAGGVGMGTGGGAPLSPSMSNSSISPPSNQPHLFGAYAASRLPLLQQQQGQQVDVLPPQQQQYGGSSGSIAGLDPLLLSQAQLQAQAAGRERQPSFPSLGPSLVAQGGPYGSAALLSGPTPRQQAMNPLASPPLVGMGVGGGGFSPALGVIPRTQNPADMNAPKNTLYVGGLPAVLPSLTGPFSASHLEDSLRNAFSRCPGFKRLQFRSKSNGPIVFVEFVDTAHATRAMQELYGHTLGGLVKGGIRLSYSKNPLGVRSNGLPSGNSPSMSPPHALEAVTPQLGGSGYGTPSSGFGLGGGGGPSPLVGGSQVPYEPLGFDPHRRPPDPIYGEPAFPPSQPSLSGSAHILPPLGVLPLQHQLHQQHQQLRSPAMTSPLGGGPHGFGGSGGASSSSGGYGGAFSPFGADL